MIIDKKNGINVGETWCIRQDERFPPALGPVVVPGAFDDHIVGCSFPASLKPGCQQVFIGKFNQSGTVTVLLLEGKNLLNGQCSDLFLQKFSGLC